MVLQISKSFRLAAFVLLVGTCDAIKNEEEQNGPISNGLSKLKKTAYVQSVANAGNNLLNMADDFVDEVIEDKKKRTMRRRENPKTVMPDLVQNNIIEPAQAISTVSYKNIKKVLKNIDNEFEVLKNTPDNVPEGNPTAFKTIKKHSLRPLTTVKATSAVLGKAVFKKVTSTEAQERSTKNRPVSKVLKDNLVSKTIANAGGYLVKRADAVTQAVTFNKDKKPKKRVNDVDEAGSEEQP